MTPGQRINQLRIHKDLTQDELAKELGLNTPAKIIKWESDSHLPNGRELRNLAYLFDVSADYLLGLDHFIKPKK